MATMEQTAHVWDARFVRDLYVVVIFSTSAKIGPQVFAGGLMNGIDVHPANLSDSVHRSRYQLMHVAVVESQSWPVFKQQSETAVLKTCLLQSN